ncbi:MAG: hypothetical protein UX90_C0002G0138 [Candidatus Wolfebacteria bacterium GW2011_GWD2_47_17]|nr:MAG: hypothetical protein UX90_C0002G0138 [Candidatus Wolfebacteria bacterium GW2011_GWD2_47_17]
MVILDLSRTELAEVIRNLVYLPQDPESVD